jgi:lysophospholipase L1-like esterase
MRKTFALLLIILSAMTVTRGQSIVINEPVRFLALGDSYTIGQSVAENQRWPVQLINALKTEYELQDAEVDIIARTGWTTSNLKSGIAQQLDTGKTYNLASLLIGVNNQYQGLDFNRYEPEFRELLETAIDAVGGETGKVFVVSIPDYAYTPSFRNDARVSSEIDAYNAVNKSIANEYGVLYFDITPISRRGLEDPGLVAEDQLHPSGMQYSQWVSLMLSSITVNTVSVGISARKSGHDILVGLQQDELSLELPVQGGRLSLHDAMGRIRAMATIQGDQHVLNVAQWAPGIYFINYFSDRGAYTGKVFID